MATFYSTKQFKIGERAIGGIIKVIIEKNLISIYALDYNTKNRVSSKDFWLSGYDVEYDVELYLDELSTSYHASKIMEYIKTKVTFNQQF